MAQATPHEALASLNDVEIRTYSQVDCYLCHRAGDYLYQGFSDRLFYAPGTWSLRRCRNSECRLVWLDPQPDINDIGKLYAGYYTAEPAKTTPALKKWIKQAVLAAFLGYKEERSAAQVLCGKLLGMLPTVRDMASATVMYLPRDWRGRVLDIGCGNGVLLRNLRELGWGIHGIDPDSHAVASTNRLLGPVARVGDVNSAESDFDVITMNHVIEHVPDPIETLRKCYAKLRPGGHVVLQTPNAEGWGARFFRETWVAWDPPRHLFVFTPATLRRVAYDAGFVVDEVRTTARGAHFSWTMSRAIKRGVDTRRLISVGRSHFLDTMAAAVFQILEFIRGSARGDEIVLTAHRT